MEQATERIEVDRRVRHTVTDAEKVQAICDHISLRLVCVFVFV